MGAATKFAPPLVASGRVYQATYDNQVVVYGLGAPSPTPARDMRRTVVFIFGQTGTGQDMFVRGGAKNGGRVRIRHRNWLNPQTNHFRWGDAYLDWDAPARSARRNPRAASAADRRWSGRPACSAESGQPFVWNRGFGIADENTFGPHYWMLDVDMDCEQAFDDGQGRRWFELKAFIAQTPGCEGDVAQTSNPTPPYTSPNHLGICGMVNVFVANFPNHPAALDPNRRRSARPATRFSRRSTSGVRRTTSSTAPPASSPGIETRCLGNVAQSCQAVDGGKFFRTIQDCNASSSGGNFVKMCQKSTGQCCTPSNTSNCQ